MYTDFDDIGALACLHALADAGECEILATLSSTRESMSVAVCELVNAYCGRPHIPVGCVKGIGVGRDASGYHEIRYRAVVDKYAKWVRYRNSDDAPDAAEVYRKTLAAPPDGSVVICSVGFLSNMARLVESDRGLVARKVKLWVAMACRYPRGGEYNAKCDWRSSKKALEEWPTPIVFCDFNYGVDCYAGRVLMPEAVGDNPISDVFRTSAKHCNGAGGRSAWDQAAVLVAVRGTEKYFNVERGTYRMVGEEGVNEWIPGGENARDCRIVEKICKAEVGRVIDSLMMSVASRSHLRK
jgi:inosine-uridine nucleoside N-ribohydrolase